MKSKGRVDNYDLTNWSSACPERSSNLEGVNSRRKRGGGVNGFGCGNKVPELAESHAFWCPGFLAEVFVLTA